MRILQVSSAEEYGGGERHVSDLASDLSQRGHDVHLAVRSHTPLRSILADNRSITWHELPFRNALDLSSIVTLKRIIRDHRIEIVHAHVARDYPVAGLAAKLNHTPFVLTRHHFNPLKGARAYAWTFGDMNRVIAVSRSVAATLTRDLPPRFADRIIVIPNWINLEESAPVDREAARQKLGINRPFAAGIAGKITPSKGHSIFLQAAERLVNREGHRDIDFIIAGEAERRHESYERDLREQIESGGINDYVKFVGFVPGLDRLFTALDVVVAPSEDEGFSLVLAEAMASRCAVVAADRGGISELVEDGVTGVLVRSLNADAFAGAINTLLGDSHLRASLGAEARRSVISRFSREVVIDQIESLYRSLVSPVSGSEVVVGSRQDN
jgi:glycosyltransferase involved in cell wall biosynthesis